jgi:hypothetical protein
VFSLLTPAHADEDHGLSIRIIDIRRAGPSTLGVDLQLSGLAAAEQAEVTVEAEPGGHATRATVVLNQPSRLSIGIDLKAGKVRLGRISIAEFQPVPPPEENIGFPIRVTVVQGLALASDRRMALLPLPTVIVPGYLNDLWGEPESGIIRVLARRGYQTSGVSPDLFWFNYRSRRLSLEAAASALATYVRTVVLPSAYAARINVVGYSLGGLMARWNVAFEPGWDHLVNRLVLIGVPNQGAVTGYVYAYYPVAGLARTRAARALLPTFPFWRRTPGDSWTLPSDAQNSTLAKLNATSIPEGIRAYAFYGSGRRTGMGVTGDWPDLNVAYAPGDGIVLVASALGLPINGGTGIAGLTERLAVQIDLGSVGHQGLLNAAAPKIADALFDMIR